jgi:hypothetical protein
MAGFNTPTLVLNYKGVKLYHSWKNRRPLTFWRLDARLALSPTTSGSNDLQPSKERLSLQARLATRAQLHSVGGLWRYDPPHRRLAPSLLASTPFQQLRNRSSVFSPRQTASTSSRVGGTDLAALSAALQRPASRPVHAESRAHESGAPGSSCARGGRCSGVPARSRRARLNAC